MTTTVPMNELRWRCRRGMLELDEYLRRFLVHGYDQLNDDERSAFYRLLDFQDQELLEVLSGQTFTSDRELHPIVEHIRATAALSL